MERRRASGKMRVEGGISLFGAADVRPDALQCGGRTGRRAGQLWTSRGPLGRFGANCCKCVNAESGSRRAPPRNSKFRSTTAGSRLPGRHEGGASAVGALLAGGGASDLGPTGEPDARIVDSGKARGRSPEAPRYSGYQLATAQRAKKRSPEKAPVKARWGEGIAGHQLGTADQ